MPITLAADGNIRNEVLAFLAKQKAENPHYTVVDVGGASNPWADQFINTYIDLHAFPTEKEVIQGDICLERFWRSRSWFWDFSICTHTLEDVRNPDTVLYWLQRISGAGFISVPNKHTELTPGVESYAWTGYAHHRWVYSLTDQGLNILAKTAFANIFIPMRHLLEWMKDDRVATRGGFPELGFMWDKDFPYTFIGHDLTDAHCPPELGDFYIKELADGL